MPVEFDTETAIMRDAFRLLRDYNNAPDSPDWQVIADWYDGFAHAVYDFTQKYKTHPLAVKMGWNVYDYVDQKFKNRRNAKA